jgi:hypothetical protein
MTNSLQRLKVAFLILILSLPQFSLGQAGTPGRPGIRNPLSGNSNIFQFIEAIIKAAMQLGALLAVLAMVYAGFLFVTAQGDEGKNETAKKVLLYTAIGIAILLGAKVLTDIIVNTVTSVREAS